MEESPILKSQHVQIPNEKDDLVDAPTNKASLPDLDDDDDDTTSLCGSSLLPDEDGSSIYGREKGIRFLRQAVHKRLDGAELNAQHQLLLVSGSSGTGKTSLVKAGLRDMVIEEYNGCFVLGKFDQQGIRKPLPYGPIVSALSQFSSFLQQQLGGIIYIRSLRNQRGDEVCHALATMVPELAVNVLAGTLRAMADALMSPPIRMIDLAFTSWPTFWLRDPKPSRRLQSTLKPRIGCGSRGRSVHHVRDRHAHDGHLRRRGANDGDVDLVEAVPKQIG